MAKVLVYQKDGESAPFLRGLLTRSLQDTGLSFDEAYGIADEVRQTLGDREEITTHELTDIVLKTLKKKEVDTETIQHYQTGFQPEPPIEVVGANDNSTAFSQFHLTHCLQSCALSPENAGHIASRIHQRLVQSGTQRIKSVELCQMVYDNLLEEMGKKVANRYLVWVEYLRTDRPLIILLNGTTGTGKSTLASGLANQLNIIRIQSTDMLREVMRLMIPASLMPALHTSTFLAWRKLPHRSNPESTTPEADHNARTIDGYRIQSETVCVAIDGVLQRALRERVSMIIEGIHLSPEYLDNLQEESDAILVPIALGILSRRTLRKRIIGRGNAAPSRRSQRYLDHFEDIWNLQNYLLSEADRLSIPIVRNRNNERAIKQVLDVITARLSKEYRGDPKKLFKA